MAGAPAHGRRVALLDIAFVGQYAADLRAAGLAAVRTANLASSGAAKVRSPHARGGLTAGAPGYIIPFD